MPRIRYNHHVLDANPQESVLDAFLRNGVEIPFSCRGGVCQACLRRALKGGVPEIAQTGLLASLKTRGYFLACQCVPVGDMEIAAPDSGDLYIPAVVHSKELLAADVCRVLLEPASALEWKPGQFVNVRRSDGLARSYSIASIAEEDYFVEIHVQRMQGGAMSNWFFDTLAAGDEVELQGPIGHCYYSAARRDQPLLLIGTGTGLAPLVGVIRDALRRGHDGPIHLYHGSREATGQYLLPTLRALEAAHANFRYSACVTRDVVPEGMHSGRADTIAFAHHGNLHAWQVYLAGATEMVDAAETVAIERGVRNDEIFADPFLLRDLRHAARETPPAVPAPVLNADRPKDPPPDAELWAAMRGGELLIEILQDFYTRVYADPRLSPFFRGTTKQRSIEKQASFMRQIFTGEKLYFGDRPRNAHHWMVISEELFNYREALMVSVLHEHGLSGPLIERWRAIEQYFRRDIVKSEPWKRVVDGVEMPLDGFEEITIDVGSLCDGCGGEIAAGERVRYHVRIGETFCPRCTTPSSSSPAPVPGV